MSHKVNIVLGTTSMEITALPTVSNTTELIKKANISAVIGVKRNVKPTTVEDAPWWDYPYPTMTIIDVLMQDGSSMKIELQDVANQGTWNTGTLAAQNAAIAAINAWL